MADVLIRRAEIDGVVRDLWLEATTSSSTPGERQ